MKISGHKTRAIFERYNIVDNRDIEDAGEEARGVFEGSEGAGMIDGHIEVIQRALEPYVGKSARIVWDVNPPNRRMRTRMSGGVTGKVGDYLPMSIPRWSHETLDEVHRNLVKRWEYTIEQADRRLSAMRTAFEDAEVTGYESLVSAMTNEIDDRHVLAAAVYSGSHAIVTQNVKDFPEESLKPYGIELMTADAFLVNQFHLDSEGIIDKLKMQAQKKGRTLTDLTKMLGSRGRRTSLSSSPTTPKFDLRT